VLNADGDGIASGLGRSEAFGLDALGNWRTYGVDSDGNGTNDLDQTRVHNAVNEIDTTDDHGDTAGDAIAATTGSNWIDPVYDAAGNMRQGPQPQNPLVAGTGETVRLHYAYDAWNRMAGVWRDSVGSPGTPGIPVYTYGYDGLHRRIRRSTLMAPTWYYYNESWQVLEERDSQESPKVQYVWDVRYIDAAVCRDRDWNADGDCTDAATGTPGSNTGDEHLYYTQDANFNVTSLVDGYDGATVERYAYDPYGKPTFLNGVRDMMDYATTQWQVRLIYTFENEILYCGYRYDPLAGHYHVRYRVYHPTLGRWTARDPSGYEDGVSLYQYVQGAPISGQDPNGLRKADILFIDHLVKKYGLSALGRRALHDTITGAAMGKAEIESQAALLKKLGGKFIKGAGTALSIVLIIDAAATNAYAAEVPPEVREYYDEPRGSECIHCVCLPYHKTVSRTDYVWGGIGSTMVEVREYNWPNVEDKGCMTRRKCRELEREAIRYGQREHGNMFTAITGIGKHVTHQDYHGALQCNWDQEEARCYE